MSASNLIISLPGSGTHTVRKLIPGRTIHIQESSDQERAEIKWKGPIVIPLRDPLMVTIRAHVQGTEIRERDWQELMSGWVNPYYIPVEFIGGPAINVSPMYPLKQEIPRRILEGSRRIHYSARTSLRAH